MRSLVTALVLAIALAAWPAGSQARAGVSFGFYGPGVGFHIGRPYYGYRHYRYPYYYGYYPRYRYYRRYSPRYYRGGGYRYWSRRCAANWGWRNNNWRGCMRYHGY